MKKFAIILTIALLLTCAVSLASCGNKPKHDIPLGYYYYDSPTSTAGGWFIYEKKANYKGCLYGYDCKIVEEDGKIYFVNKKDEIKHEAEFDSATNTLTVYEDGEATVYTLHMLDSE